MSENVAPVPDPAPVPSLQVEAWTYGPDHGCSPLGLVLTIVIQCIAGFVCGALASFISQWIYFVLMFPIGIGLILGFTGALAVQFAKVRSPLLGGLAGFLGGCVAMLAMHYCNYTRMVDVLRANPEIGAVADQLTFVDFMELRANVGVQIGGGRKGNGLNLGYVGSYIYWGLETLVVAGMSFFVLRNAAGEPFCRNCNVWKTETSLGTIVADRDSVLQSLQQGDIGRIASLAADKEPQGDVKAMLLKASVCPKCGREGHIHVKLEELSKNDKGELVTTEIAHMTMAGEALAPLETSLAASQEPERAKEES